MENRFLRRRGMLTLKKFAEINGLTMTTERSSQPTVMPFYVLKPAYSVPITSEPLGTLLWWDNSIFSKIVDEFADAPRKVKGLVAPKGSDSRIEELRKSVSDEMLTSTARQDFMISYSKEHFGSRAFDGR
jgi:hypothetical protein